MPIYPTLTEASAELRGKDGLPRESQMWVMWGCSWCSWGHCEMIGPRESTIVLGAYRGPMEMPRARHFILFGLEASCSVNFLLHQRWNNEDTPFLSLPAQEYSLCQPKTMANANRRWEESSFWCTLRRKQDILDSVNMLSSLIIPLVLPLSWALSSL